MAKLDLELQRLLARAATAPVPSPPPEEMPFGFETRVVALAAEARRAAQGEARQLHRFLRRAALLAAVVTLFSSGAAYWQMNENDDLTESSTNAYAIADNVIEADLFQ